MTVARDLAGGPARRVRRLAGSGLARSPASLPVSLGHGRVSWCTQIGVIGAASPVLRPAARLDRLHVAAREARPTLSWSWLRRRYGAFQQRW